MAERCELTELLTDQCAHCRGIPGEPAPNPYGKRPQVAARYPGWCSGCGEPFGQGDQIRADGIGGWLAECCGGNLD